MVPKQHSNPIYTLLLTVILLLGSGHTFPFPTATQWLLTVYKRNPQTHRFSSWPSFLFPIFHPLHRVQSSIPYTNSTVPSTCPEFSQILPFAFTVPSSHHLQLSSISLPCRLKFKLSVKTHSKSLLFCDT